MGKSKFSPQEALFHAWTVALALAFSASFYQVFQAPKMIVFYVGLPLLLASLAVMDRIRLPSQEVLLIAGAFVAWSMIGAIFASRAYLAFEHAFFYLGSFGLYVFLLNLSVEAKRRSLGLVLSLAVLQAGFLLLVKVPFARQFLPEAILAVPRTVGTIGNAEFLSAFLGVGALIALRPWLEAQSKVKKVAGSLLFLACVGALVLAKSKGSLLILGAIYLWNVFPQYRKQLSIGGAVAFMAACVFLVSAKARLFLWLIGGRMFLEHPLIGVGPAEFGHHYMGTIASLFTSFPALAGVFGDLSGNILEAHNLVLQLGAEHGAPGLFFGAILLFVAAKKCTQLPAPYSWALALLLVKCLYTVVLSPPTGILLFLVLFTMAEDSHARAFSPALPLRWSVPVLATVASVFLCGFWLSDREFYAGHRALYLGKPGEARSRLAESLRLNPDNGEAYLDLAYLHFQQGRLDEMEENIRQSLRRLKTINSYKLAARMEFTAGLYPQAQSKYEYLHKVFPEHVTSTTRLAELYLKQGSLEKAKALATSVLFSSPRVPTKSHDFNLIWADDILKKISFTEGKIR